MSSNSGSLTRGYAIALVSAAILSSTGIFLRYLTQAYSLPPLILAFWRDLFVVVTLAAVFTVLHFCGVRSALSHFRVKRRHLAYLASYGAVLAAFNAFLTHSVAINGAALSTVLVYCSAAFTALLGWACLGERLDWAKLAAVGLCLGGCVCVSGALSPEAWRTNLLGVVVGIVSGLAYAVYSMMGRSAAQRGLNPWTTLLYTFGFAALFLLSLNLAAGKWLPGAAARPADLFWLGDAAAGWGLLVLLAAGPTVAGFGLYNVCLGYLPSSVANLILTSETAFTAVIAYILLGERLNGQQIVGSLMILGGVVFLRIYEGWLAGQAQLSMLSTSLAEPAADS